MYDYVVVDVFSRVPLEGNPLAVFTDGIGLDTDTMQRAARELNLSETVFLLPPTQPHAHARLRIFTPTTELGFAGHPVLGTSLVVANREGVDVVHLETAAGVIQVSLEREGEPITTGSMIQPIPVWEAFDRIDELFYALGVEGSLLPVEAYGKGRANAGPRHIMVALADESIVRGLSPDFGALARLGRLGVSCFAHSELKVTTRMFGPGIGVSEDPATGSAAGPVAIHLARHGRIGFGDRIELHQGAEIGRPSVLYAVAEGTPERIERLTVSGDAVVVAWGRYRLN